MMSLNEAKDHICWDCNASSTDVILDNSKKLILNNIERDTQAFSLLYNTLLEVGDIIQRGIREGERGHRKALHDAMEMLKRIE